MTGEGNDGARRSSRKRVKISSTKPEDNHANNIQKKRTRQSKAGRLAELLNMPIDILLEIFGHLRPLDLLFLARTSKEFRRVLMHRSSTSVWKAARANVPGFPDCPPDLTEPQWANLAFYPHCNICLTPGVRNVDWRLRIRICAKCAKEHIMDPSSVGYYVTDAVRRLVPHRPGKRSGEVYLLEEFVSLCQQYTAIEDPDRRSAFLEERHKFTQEIEKHAILCEQWAMAQAQDRSQELQQSRDDRKQAIIDKLTSLGWEDEIRQLPYNALETHKLVRVPQQLTERIWKNISKSMIEFMEEMKAERLERELANLILVRKAIAIDILRTYKISQLPFTIVMPEPYDFCSFPLIQNMIERPLDVEVNESAFADVMPMLPGLFDDWRKSITTQLVKRMKTLTAGRNSFEQDEIEGGVAHEVTDDKLVEKMKLATTVFKCRACGYTDHHLLDSDSDSGSDMFDFLLGYNQTCEPLFYPKVLGHRCLTKPSGFSFSNDPSVHFKNRPLFRRRWSCGCLELDKASGKIVEGIVKMCGLDPITATANDMDQLDARMACLRCVATEEDLTPVFAFGWRSAVKHHIENHEPAVGSWRMLLADEDRQARLFEQALLKELSEHDFAYLPSDQVVWSCMYCLDLPTELRNMSLQEVETHLMTTHHIFQPQLNRDYGKDFAAPELYQTDILFQASLVGLEAGLE